MLTDRQARELSLTLRSSLQSFVKTFFCCCRSALIIIQKSNAGQSYLKSRHFLLHAAVAMKTCVQHMLNCTVHSLHVRAALQQESTIQDAILDAGKAVMKLPLYQVVWHSHTCRGWRNSHDVTGSITVILQRLV